MENEPLKQSVSGMNNIVSIVLGVAVVGLLAIGGYISQTNDIVPKGKENSFQDLPKNVQEQYILKNEILDLEKELQDTKAKAERLQLQRTEPKVDQENQENQNIAISTVTSEELNKKLEIREKVIEKIIEIKTEIDKDKYKTYTCKSFEAGGIVIPQSCKKELFQFLDSHQDSKLFEIIGLVDNTEFRLIKNLEEVYGKEKIKDIKKYVQRGLSRQRVVEMTWLIKEHFRKLGNDEFKLNAVNYSLYSKDKRGFVIKAYY